MGLGDTILMVWERLERALASSNTCRAPPAAMLKSSSQNTRMRMVCRWLVSHKPFSQAVSEIRPAKPSFDKASSHGCHVGLPALVVQECLNGQSQCLRIIRGNQIDSCVSIKYGGDRRDRTRYHGLSAAKVVKDFHRR